MASKDDYKPVGCGFYDEIELAVVRGSRLRITYRDASGHMRNADGVPIEIQTTSAGEFLILRAPTGVTEAIRLDAIDDID